MMRRVWRIGGPALSSLALLGGLDRLGWARPHGLVVSTLADGGDRFLPPGFTFFGREWPLGAAYVWIIAVVSLNVLAWRFLLGRRSGPGA